MSLLGLEDIWQEEEARLHELSKLVAKPIVKEDPKLEERTRMDESHIARMTQVVTKVKKR